MRQQARVWKTGHPPPLPRRPPTHGGLSSLSLQGGVLLLFFPESSGTTISLMAMPLLLLATESRTTGRLFLLSRVALFARSVLPPANAYPLSLASRLPIFLADTILPRLLSALLVHLALSHCLSPRTAGSPTPNRRPLFPAGWRLYIAMVAFAAFVSSFPFPLVTSDDGAAGGEAHALQTLGLWLSITERVLTTLLSILLASFAHRAGFPEAPSHQSLLESDEQPPSGKDDSSALRMIALQDALERAKTQLDEAREQQQRTQAERDAATLALDGAGDGGGGDELRRAEAEAEQLRAALDEARNEAHQAQPLLPTAYRPTSHYSLPSDPPLPSQFLSCPALLHPSHLPLHLPLSVCLSAPLNPPTPPHPTLSTCPHGRPTLPARPSACPRTA